MANYLQELAQDAVCQSHTGHMTDFWFLPARPLRLNTNERIRSLYISNLSKIFFTYFTSFVNVEGGTRQIKLWKLEFYVTIAFNFKSNRV